MRRSVTPAGVAANVERYVLEDGWRTLTLDGAGQVTRRYQSGPAGEVLFDQAFDALGQEADLALPLGDHQHSTRVALRHERERRRDGGLQLQLFGAAVVFNAVVGQAGQRPFLGE